MNTKLKAKKQSSTEAKPMKTTGIIISEMLVLHAMMVAFSGHKKPGELLLLPVLQRQNLQHTIRHTNTTRTKRIEEFISIIESDDFSPTLPLFDHAECFSSEEKRPFVIIQLDVCDARTCGSMGG